MTTPPDEVWLTYDQEGVAADGITSVWLSWSSESEGRISYTRTDLIPKWIPVSERLPEGEGLLIVWTKSHKPEGMSASEARIRIDIGSPYFTHWRYIGPPEDV